MSHPFYPSGNPRFNHVAMSVPADQLEDPTGPTSPASSHDVLGFDELTMMTVDRQRLIYSCVHWDQFIFLIAEDDPMRCPRMDHYGFAVGTLDELLAARDRAVAFRDEDDRVDLRRPHHRRPGRRQDPLDLRALPAADDVRAAVLGVPVVRSRRRPASTGPRSGEAEASAGRSAATELSPRPGGPSRARPPAGAPNVVTVVLDDVGFAQLGCFGSDIETPTIDRLAAGGLRYRNFHTDRPVLAHPGLRAHGSQPPLGRHRSGHRPGHRVPRLRRPHPGVGRPCCPRCSCPHGYAAYAVGKWHLTPEEDLHLGAPRSTWPLGPRLRALLRVHRRRDEPVRARAHPRQPPGRATPLGRRRLPPQRGPGRPRHRVHRRPAPRPAGPAVPPPPGPGRLPLAPPGSRSAGSSTTGVASTRDGTAWRAATLGPPARARADRAEGVELSPRPDWVPAWDSLERRRAAPLRPLHGVLRRLALPCRRADRPSGRSSLGRTRRPRRHAAHGAVRQRRIERGRTDRIDQRRAPVEPRRPTGGRGARADRRDRGSPDPQQLPVGLDRRREHPVPALEAGGPRRRRLRPAHRALARRHRRDAARCASQYVHAIDLLPTILDAAGVAAPDAVGGVDQKPIEGVSIRSTFASADADEVRTTQYFEMLGCRAIYHEGWKAVTLRLDDDGRDGLRRRRLGALRRARRSRPSATTGPKPSPSGCRRWSSAGGPRPRRTRCCRSTRCRSSRPSARDPVSPASFAGTVYWPGTGPVDEAGAVDVQSRSHEVTARSTSPRSRRPTGAGIRPRACSCPQGSGYGGWALWVAGGRLHYAHNFVSMEDVAGGGRPAGRPPGATRSACATSTALGGPRRGGRRHAGDRRRGGRLGRGSALHPHPLVDLRRRAHRRATRWPSLWCATSPRRSRSPAPSTQVAIDVDGGPVVDVEARAEQSMRAQ